MHQAQSYILAVVIPPGADMRQVVLQSRFASGIEQRLMSDSIGYCYSGAVSIADAARGIGSGFYSWATVKLYYGAFYLTRALLAMKGISIFHVGRSPYRWKATVGEMPRKLTGNTHRVVLNSFAAERTHPHLISQIGGVSALTWLCEKREEANYGKAKFEEPAIPAHFERIVEMGVRRAIDGYLSDQSFLYSFDADHAMLAYPLELWRQVLADIGKLPSQFELARNDRTYLAKLFTDARGRLAAVDRLVNP